MSKAARILLLLGGLIISAVYFILKWQDSKEKKTAGKGNPDSLAKAREAKAAYAAARKAGDDEPEETETETENASEEKTQ